MTHPLSLDALFAALRNAGLQVGVSEVLRLQRVFALQPDLLTNAHADTRRRLKAVLRAVLVNTREDYPAFERAYDAWLAFAEQEIALRSAPPSPPKPPQHEPAEPKRP